MSTLHCGDAPFLLLLARSLLPRDGRHIDMASRGVQSLTPHIHPWLNGPRRTPTSNGRRVACHCQPENQAEARSKTLYSIGEKCLSRAQDAEPERLATRAWGMSGPVPIQEQNRKMSRAFRSRHATRNSQDSSFPPISNAYTTSLQVQPSPSRHITPRPTGATRLRVRARFRNDFVRKSQCLTVAFCGPFCVQA